MLERDIGLNEYMGGTGVKLDARPSTELLLNIFEPQTPLHDGGGHFVGRKDCQCRQCTAPLTERRLEGGLGTRHRAAVGISEQTDAVVVVVSEETGTISLAVDGRLRRYLSAVRLREQLAHYLRDGGEK